MKTYDDLLDSVIWRKVEDGVYECRARFSNNHWVHILEIDQGFVVDYQLKSSLIIPLLTHITWQEARTLFLQAATLASNYAGSDHPVDCQEIQYSSPFLEIAVQEIGGPNEELAR